MSSFYSVGVMTGTSCDGADLAILKFDLQKNKWQEQFIAGMSSAFPQKLRSRLRNAQTGEINIPTTFELARDYSEFLSGFCHKAIQKYSLPKSQTILSIHGQTVWHQPPLGKKLGFSAQLLDPYLIVVKTGLTVISGFRQPDLALGGQGAPLVPYYHWLRAKSTPYKAYLPFAVHNVGGIGNLTYLGKEVFAFDTGPGNVFIDLAVEKLTKGKDHYDRNGNIALEAASSVDWKWVESFCKKESYFKQKPPKSTGRELFNEAYLKRIPAQGKALVATATAVTAHSMAMAYRDFVLNKKRKLNAVFVAGGGAKNPTLLRFFSRELARLTKREIWVVPMPPDFAPPQYLEAMAFARFGIEALQLKPVSLKCITGAKSDATGAGFFPGSNFKRLAKLVGIV